MTFRDISGIDLREKIYVKNKLRCLGLMCMLIDIHLTANVYHINTHLQTKSSGLEIRGADKVLRSI